MSTTITNINRYYPKLSELLDDANIPDSLGDFREALIKSLGKIYYTNFQKMNSNLGEPINFYIEAILKKSFELEILNGVRLVVNGGNGSDVTVFPINVFYEWRIWNYLKAFKANSLDFSKDSIFDLGLKVVNLDLVDALSLAINKFEKPIDSEQTKVERFIERINESYFTTVSASEDELKDTSILLQLIKYNKDINDDISTIVFKFYIFDPDPDKLLLNLNKFFSNIIPNDLESFIKDIVYPKIKANVNLKLGLEFDRKYLTPVYNIEGVNPFNELDLGDPLTTIPESDLEGNPKYILNLADINLFFDSESGLGSSKSIELENVSPVKIGKTDLILEFKSIKVDLSKSKNNIQGIIWTIPDDFMGVYVGEANIFFPAKWNHDPEDEGNTAHIKARNLLIGTGGVSGTLSLEAIDPKAETAALLKLRLGENFNISLDAFSITFQQNEILNSYITGTLTLPGFKQKDEEGEYTNDPVELAINVFIGNNGDFKISAAPVEELSFYIEKVAKISVYSLAVGEESGKFYIDVSGEIDFTELTNNLPNVSSDMPTNVPIRKLRVWEDGKMEFDGGVVHLPRAVGIKIGHSEMMVNSLLFSSTTLKHGSEGDRNYNIIGFDGNLKLSPGGIAMKGDGVKIYYTTDNTVYDPHIFVRLEKLDITITVPEGADKSTAQFFLHGSLAMKNKDGVGASELQSYSGSIDFSINTAKVTGSAAMEYTPSIPRWFIDAQVDIESGLPMGTTGLAVYGFKGLAGQGKRFNKVDEENWWHFYKRPQEGINLDKFNDEKGFALGLGISIASKENEGRPFSSILTLVLGLPDAVLFNGRAAIMEDKVKFGDEDPPFSALLAIDSKSIQAGLGVKFSKGEFADLTGTAEMAYFWNDASAWYINLGKDLPESERIKARIFKLFDAYAYLMLSSSGVKFGAGAKWEFEKDIANVIYLNGHVYLDMYGRLSLNPTQIGGGISLGGVANVKISKFKLGFILDTYLQAESKKPKQIKGGLDLKIELPKPIKSKSIHLEFNWIYDQTRLDDPLDIIEVSSTNIPAQAVSMLTGETFEIGLVKNTYSTVTDYPVIPIDSFVDISFANSPRLNLSPGNKVVVGGEVTAVNSRLLVPPTKGISEQVKHEFEINSIDIKSYDGSAWQDYNIFEASDTIKTIPEIASELLSDANYLKNMPQAYWQLMSEGINSTLRVMGTNMFSYMNQTINGSVIIERLGYEGAVIFCEQSKIQNIEINWENDTVDSEYNANSYYNKDGVRVKVFTKNGSVKNVTNSFGLNHGLEFSESDGIEIVFGSPQSVVKPCLVVSSGDYLHVEYLGKETVGMDHNNHPIEQYVSLRTDKLNGTQLTTYQGYSDDEDPVFKVKITYYKTGMLNANHNGVLRIGYPSDPDTYNAWCNGLICIDDVLIVGKAFDYIEMLNIYDNGYSGGNVIAHWELNGNGSDSSGNSFNGTAINSPYLTDGRNANSANAYYLGANHLFSYAVPRYLEVPHNAALSVGKDNFTIMSWVKLPPSYMKWDNWYMGKRTIVSKMKKVDGGYQLGITGLMDYNNSAIHTHLVFEYKHDNSTGGYIDQVWIDFDGFMDGNWHHVAAVKTFGYDPDTKINTNVVDLFIDGIWMKRRAIVIPVPTSSDTSAIVKLNYLDQESYLKNLRIPSQSTLNTLNQKMKDGLTKTVQPIWRPDTRYQIIVTGKDIVDGNNENLTYTAYFRTEGSTGFFVKEGIEIDDDKFKLGRIKAYIDYDRSYPNAAGQLNDSKPMYYEDAKLNLFYKAPYMNLMFDTWAAYQGLSATEYALKLRVMDSRTAEDVTSNLNPTWTYKDDIIENEDIRTLNNLPENGDNCWGVSGAMKRKSAAMEYVLPNLLANNLYSVTYISVNKNNDEEIEVHKHVFQTSNFKNFVSHISSFSYTKQEKVSVVQIQENFDSGSGSFSASTGSSLSVSDMVVIESSHHPSCQFEIPVVFGVPYEIIGDVKGYSYNFGGKSDFFCKVDNYPLYNGNLMNIDRQPQEINFRVYSEKTGTSKVEFGLNNNKIGLNQHFVLNELKVQVPAFDEVYLLKNFEDDDLGDFVPLSGAAVTNASGALHVENTNNPHAGITFDVQDGVTYTITFDLLATTSNGGGSTDLRCLVGNMLNQVLPVSPSFPQTLTCNFTANASGIQQLELSFATPTVLGTMESFEMDNFKIEHSVVTPFDIFSEDFSSGLGDVSVTKLSHVGAEGVLYSESSSTVPQIEIPVVLEANAKYKLHFDIPAQSYNEAELDVHIQIGSLVNVELEAGTGSEITYEFETTTSVSDDLTISLKSASSSVLEYLMIDNFTLSYEKMDDVEILSLFEKELEISETNIDKAIDIVTNSNTQDLDLCAKFPLKYDRLLNGALAPMGDWQACERLEIHKIINTSDNDALIGLIVRSPEPLFMPTLSNADLNNSLTISCDVLGGGTESNFTLEYSKDKSCVFVTKNDLSIPNGEYHFNFNFLKYNGATYSVQNTETDQFELVVNI
jgi:hypothetical protein